MNVREGRLKALVIRVRQAGFEVPKGHIEPGETVEQTAIRELHEETGLASPVTPGPRVGMLEYTFRSGDRQVHKTVHYLVALPRTKWVVEFGRTPSRTKELRWLVQSDVQSTPYVSNGIPEIIHHCFDACSMHDT